MTRHSKCPARRTTAPLAASAEPLRLAFLPGLQGPSGEPLAALVAGHPRRPLLVAAFPNVTAALAALREAGR